MMRWGRSGVDTAVLILTALAAFTAPVQAQYQVLGTPSTSAALGDIPQPSFPGSALSVDAGAGPVLVGEWRDFSLLRTVIPESWLPFARRLSKSAAPVPEPSPRTFAERVAALAASGEEERASPPVNDDAQRAACSARLDAVMERQAITFASGGATMTGDSDTVLAAVAEVMQSCPEEVLYVAGHTDSVGDPASNLALSVARAEAVVDGLVELGISPARLFALGYGASLPVADNATADGRQANRRIVLSFEDGAVVQ